MTPRIDLTAKAVIHEFGQSFDVLADDAVVDQFIAGLDRSGRKGQRLVATLKGRGGDDQWQSNDRVATGDKIHPLVAGVVHLNVVAVITVDDVVDVAVHRLIVTDRLADQLVVVFDADLRSNPTP